MKKQFKLPKEIYNKVYQANCAMEKLKKLDQEICAFIEDNGLDPDIFMALRHTSLEQGTESLSDYDAVQFKKVGKMLWNLMQKDYCIMKKSQLMKRMVTKL